MSTAIKINGLSGSSTLRPIYRVVQDLKFVMSPIINEAKIFAKESPATMAGIVLPSLNFLISFLNKSMAFTLFPATGLASIGLFAYEIFGKKLFVQNNDNDKKVSVPFVFDETLQNHFNLK